MCIQVGRSVPLFFNLLHLIEIHFTFDFLVIAIVHLKIDLVGVKDMRFVAHCIVLVYAPLRILYRCRCIALSLRVKPIDQILLLLRVLVFTVTCRRRRMLVILICLFVLMGWLVDLNALFNHLRG